MAENKLLLESGDELLLETGDTFLLEQGSFTLSVDAGAYTIVGAPSINNPGVVAAAGSYALTGTATILKATLRLVCAAGSYSLTGTAITSKRGALLSAVSGSYLITGTDAGTDHGGVTPLTPPLLAMMGFGR